MTSFFFTVYHTGKKCKWRIPNLNRYAPKVMVLFLLREKDPCDHPAEDTAEQKQDTQSRQQLADQRLAGFLLDGDVKLLEEAANCMKKLRVEPAYAAEREAVESVALCFYGEKLRQVALN